MNEAFTDEVDRISRAALGRQMDMTEAYAALTNLENSAAGNDEREYAALVRGLLDP